MILDWKYLLFAQYPAVLLLSLYFLVCYLRVRKASAIKSVVCVLLFGVALAASVLFAAFGIHFGYWKLAELASLKLASWIGLGLTLIIVIARIVHLIEKRHSRKVMEKQLKRAEEEKEAAVAKAQEEGRRAAQEEAALHMTISPAASSDDFFGSELSAAETQPAPAAYSDAPDTDTDSGNMKLDYPGSESE